MSKLILILPSEASMIKNEQFGLLPRWARLINEYKLYFEKVEIYTCDKQDFSEKLGIKHHPCKIMIDARYLKAITYNLWLLMTIPAMRSDLIRFFGSVYPLMPLFKLLNKTPKVLSYQYDFYRSTLLDFGKFRGTVAKVVEKSSVARVGNILTTTNELQQVLKDRYNLDSWVNPNFVDLETFYPSEDEEDYMFFAGRIVPSKGIDYLIDMVRKFNDKGTRLHIKLAGEGDHLRYRSLVEAEGLQDQIEFLGAVSSLRVAEYMRKCRIFVFPPITREGHPKSLIEALASGAACVVTRVLGNIEVIEDGSNGLLIEPGNLQDMMDKIGRLMKDDNFRKELKRKAVLSAQKYEVKKVVKREVDILEGIILSGK